MRKEGSKSDLCFENWQAKRNAIARAEASQASSIEHRKHGIQAIIQSLLPVRAVVQGYQTPPLLYLTFLTAFGFNQACLLYPTCDVHAFSKSFNPAFALRFQVGGEICCELHPSLMAPCGSNQRLPKLEAQLERY
jgi:hypothetical protein